MGPRSTFASASRFPLWIFALLTILLSSGCKTTKLYGEGPLTPEDIHAKGVTYYAGQHVVTVGTTVTFETVLEGNNDQIRKVIASDDDTAECRTKTLFRSTQGTVTTQVVADPTKVYRLDIEAGSNSTDDITIRLRPSGLLESVDAKVTGTTGDVIKNVASFAGKALVLATTGVPLKVNASEFAEQAGLDPGKLGVEEFFVPQLHACFLAEEKAGRRPFAAWRVLDQQIATRESQRTSLLDELQKAKTSDELDLLKAKIDVLTVDLERLRAQREAAHAAFDAPLQKYIARKGIGEKTVVSSEVFALSDFPVDGFYNGMTHEDAQTALETTPRVENLYETRGVIVTLREIEAQPTLPERPNGDKETTEIDDTSDKGRIHYRQIRPYVLTVYVRGTPPTPEDLKAGEEEANERISLQRSEVALLLHPDEPIRWVEFKPSAFSTRDLSLTSYGDGQLQSLHYVGGSDAAGATSALGDAATSMLDGYSTTLAKVNEIQQTRRAIGLDSLITETETIKQQKELLDARLALEGSTATADLLLEKQELDARLALLQSQLNAAAQGATFDATLETQTLQAQLQLMQQQLAVQAAAQTQDTNLQTQLLAAQFALLQQQAQVENAMSSADERAALAELEGQIKLLAKEIESLRTQLKSSPGGE